ncbi:MAG: OmpA family protein [Paludibacteraceae bacterium]|nr:OmpA family protein [Paludibacteraceae bacterium]
MKKLFTVCGLFLISLFAFAAAETEITTSEKSESKVLHEFKDFSHWSIQVNGGFSQFDGDANQRYDQLLSSSQLLWTVGIDVEYSFNPAWGLIANFQYMPYHAHTSSTKYGKNYFRGNMYAPSLMLSMNLLNLFGQYRSNAAWNWYLNAGVGLVFYDVQSENEGVVGEESPKEIKDGKSIGIPLGTQVEYNINDYLAVGLSGYYRIHNKDNFEGEDYTKGTMNDGEFYVTASLRVKLAPNVKEGGHMRNISMMDYRKKRTGESNLESRLDSLEKRVKVLEDTVANNILPRLDELEKQHATTPDEDGDGVPDFRDRQADTPKGAFVNYWGEGIPQEALEPACCDDVKKVFSALGIDPKVDYDMSVYYGFDKADLTAKARKNIEKAAQKLKENPDMKVELRGYCDFPGSNNYNLKLSEKRVKAVKDALVKAGIAEDRITVQPQGALANPPKAELKNRRCDFFFY